MNKLFLAGIAAFVAATLAIEYLYEWQMGLNVYQNAYWLSVVLFATGALVNVLYWYGISLVGTRYHNWSLHRLAMFALVLSILSDASNMFYTLVPQYAASSAWDSFGFVMSLLFGVAFILTGLAMQKMRSQFGDMALWYGVIAMIFGVFTITGDAGIVILGMLGVVLNAVLYVLGGLILFKAAKR